VSDRINGPATPAGGDAGAHWTGSGGWADPAWIAVDDYLALRLVPGDDALEAALAASSEAGLPPIAVSALQGRFLQLLVRLVGARHVLEIGTLGGYSAIWMARALTPDGRLVTLESSPRHAAVARANLERARLADRVDVLVGPALENLPTLPGRGYGPFDLVFIDADKANNALYLRYAVDLARPGAVVVVDNVVRHGTVADVDTANPDVLGIQEMLNLVAVTDTLDATVLQTVGSRGYDGFLVGIVR
jgi:predicted O-methyltransferase YrrM